MQPIFVCTIDCAEEYETGADVRLAFAIWNKSPFDYWLLRWNTPLEGIQSGLLTVTRDGMKIPYDGPIFKRGNPSDEDYVLLRAGESQSKTVALCDVHDLTRPGDYEARVDTYILDYCRQQPETPFRARPCERHEMLPLESDPVRFRIKRANLRCKTIGAKHRR